ncbi:MAG: hypothetical protein M1312_01115 [Patescibacteria group bacterium]|nr:hypothetical protein [Patescibacteria group bacterium]
MKRGAVMILGIVIVCATAMWLVYSLAINNKMSVPPNIPSKTSTSTQKFDKSLSDGIITIYYPSSEFGLATNQQQLSGHLAYIPPCDQGFNYCLYYSTSTYQGTNFEAAGIAINNLTATLPTVQQCLTTPPNGYTNISPTSTISNVGYSTSLFSNLGNAAMGHYATDNIYRLAYAGKCYEFDARIGQTQFANYPPGAIKLFTPADYNTVKSELQAILNTLSLPGGGSVTFPK